MKIFSTLSLLALFGSASAFCMGGSHAKNTWACEVSGSLEVTHDPGCIPSGPPSYTTCPPQYQNAQYLSDDMTTKQAAIDQAMKDCQDNDRDPSSCKLQGCKFTQ